MKLPGKIKLFFILLLLNILAAYSNHFNNSFHFDDSHVIENNLYITSLKNFREFFTNPATFSALPTNQSYRPLVTLSLAWDYFLAKELNPIYFHISNFLFFLIQIPLLFLFLYKLLSKHIQDSDSLAYTSFLATAWYSSNTALAETINYISARSDMLSSLFVIWAMLLFANQSYSRKYHLYLIPVALGILSKEQAAVFPALLFFYIFYFETHTGNNLLEKFYAALKKSMPSAITCLALLALSQISAQNWQPGGNSRLLYLLTQPFVLLDYLRLFFLPIGFSADSDWTVVSGWTDYRVALGIIFIVSLFYLIIRLSRVADLKPAAYGLLWFVITLLPTSSIIPLAEVRNDHRLYFPFAGLALSAVSILRYLIFFRWNIPLKSKQALLVTLVLIILPANLLGAKQRNSVWYSEESLWLDVTQKSPGNGRGLMNYGLTQMAIANYHLAEDYYLLALKILPNYATLHINLAILYSATSRPELAKIHFEKAKILSPKDPASYLYYARWLYENNNYEQSEAEAAIARQLSPNNITTIYLLYDIYLRQNRIEAAKKLALETLEINSNDAYSKKILGLK